MENILQHCDTSDDQDSSLIEHSEAKITDSEPVEPTTVKEDIDSEVNEKEFKIDPETNDVANVQLLTKEDNAKDAEKIDNKDIPDIDLKLEDTNDDHKNMNISFDEDIILPSVRHDPEFEQKQRDRIKRKEMKSRKELEEEEREKMQ